MSSIRFSFLTLIFVLAMTTASTPHAADARYPVKKIQKIDIFRASGGSSWENKNWLDCNDVILTEEDVRYALHHMRKISEKIYFSEKIERTGCSGGASVTFTNNKIIVINIEPTGRIKIFDAAKNLEPVGSSSQYYDCQPCKERKMALLKDALDRATKRRIQEMKRQGRLPP